MKKIILSEVAQLNPRFSVPDNTDTAMPVSFVPMSALNAQTGCIDSIDERTLGSVRNGYTYFQSSDILVAKITPCFENGKIAHVSIPHSIGFGSTEFHVIRPNENILDGRYLLHYLRQNWIRSSGERQMTGSAGQRRVPLHFLSNLELMLPPLPEQRRIAAMLDAAEAVREKRRQTLKKLDELTQAVFLEMFGKVRNSAWEWATVSDVADDVRGAIRTGPFGSQLLHSEFVEEGIPVIGIDNVVGNVFGWGERRYISLRKYETLKRYTVHPGDVLITIMGTCGRCAVVPDDIPVAINSKHLCCITLDRTKCLPEFLHAYFLRHPVAREYLTANAKGAIMAGLNMGIIKALPVPIAPISLQREFVRRLSSIDQLKAAHSVSLEKLDALFLSLQQRAFRGEV